MLKCPFPRLATRASQRPGVSPAQRSAHTSTARRVRTLIGAASLSLLVAAPASAASLPLIDAPLLPAQPAAAQLGSATAPVAGGANGRSTLVKYLTGEELAERKAWRKAVLLGEPDARFGGRVVNGQKVTINAVPWQVSIFSYDDKGGFDCGGTLIDATTVITAAHCVDGTVPGADPFTAHGIGVWAGVNTILGTERTRVPKTLQETQVIAGGARVHPAWVPKSVTAVGDLAVLKLKDAITINGTNTRAAALPAAQASVNGDPVPVGPQLLGSGYGLQNAKAEPDANLYSLPLGVISPNYCGEGSAFSALVLCAVNPTGSMCMGDSGGPIVTGAPAAPVLVGVVSNGSSECTPGSPNSFTNLTAPENRLFIDGNNAPPAAPRQTAGVEARWARPGVISGGDKLACGGGAWTGAPSVKWRVLRDDNVVAQTGVGATLEYTVAAADIGRKLSCQAFASNAGGTQISNPAETNIVVTAGTPYAYLSAPKKARRGATFTAWVYLYNLPVGTSSAVVKVSGAKWGLKSFKIGRVADSQTLKDAGAARLRVVMPRSARKGTKPKLKAQVTLYNAGKARLARVSATTKLRAN